MQGSEIIRRQIQETLPQAINELKTYVHYQSVAGREDELKSTADFVAGLINSAGGRAEVLKTAGKIPVVHGYFPAGKKGNPDKTLLFYDHYDVQPAEPNEGWSSDPFVLTAKEGKLYARGVADNKGDLIARLTAIRLIDDLDGGLPCNVTFLVEGEEETGSEHLEAFIRQNRDRFAADACIWEFGETDEDDKIRMVSGVKGMVSFELACETAEVEAHSMTAVYLPNPAWRLVQALATMKSADGGILIEGFREGVIPPSENESEAARRVPFSPEKTAELYGLKDPLATGSRDPHSSICFEPTLTICGIASGYAGEGPKAVLPGIASAKLECRLVPDQEPKHILSCIRNHLDRHGFGDVKCRVYETQRAYRSDIGDPFVTLAVKAAAPVYGSEAVLSPSSPGSGPMYEIGGLLKIPVVSTGVGWYGAHYHAPNESIRLSDFENGIFYIVNLLREFGKGKNI